MTKEDILQILDSLLSIKYELDFLMTKLVGSDKELIERVKKAQASVPAWEDKE